MTRQKACLLLLAGLLLGMCFFPLRSLSAWLGWPYPIEYRDAVSLDSAIAIHAGVNIYALESYPEHVYIYGGLYPLIISLALNFIRPSFRILYAIDLLCLLGILIIILLIFHERIRKKALRLTAGLFAIFSLLVYAVVNFGISGTRPSLPGLLCLLLSVWIAERTDYSVPGLLFSWLCSFAALNFKQYFVIGFPLVCLYVFLYRSRLKGLFYGLCGTLAMALAFWLISLKFPLYINSMIFHHLSLTSQYNGLWMCYQLIPFLILFGVLLALIARSVKKGIISKNGNIYLLGFLCCLLVFLYPMGGHWGNEYTYFIDLPLPFLLISTFTLLDQQKADAHSCRTCGVGMILLGALALFLIWKLGIQRDYLIFAWILMAFGFLGLLLPRLPFQAYIASGLALSAVGMLITQQSWLIQKADLPYEEFARFNRDLESCSAVYLVPSGYLYHLTHNNVLMLDDGVDIYTKTLIYPNSEDWIGRGYAGQTALLKKKSDAFYADVRRALAQKRFDCLTVSAIDYIHDYPELAENYEEVSVYFLTQDEPVSLMKPRGK